MADGWFVSLPNDTLKEFSKVKASTYSEVGYLSDGS